MSAMVEVKVTELEGAALDWAVAVALGWKMQRVPNDIDGQNAGEVLAPPDLSSGFRYPPRGIVPRAYFVRRWSSDWSQGGPLLENHHIELSIGDEDYWANRTCTSRYDDEPREYSGATMLIAACRAIVAFHLGDVVQVPAELAAQENSHG